MAKKEKNTSNIGHWHTKTITVNVRFDAFRQQKRTTEFALLIKNSFSHISALPFARRAAMSSLKVQNLAS